jgi:TatD DNase family protein
MTRLVDYHTHLDLYPTHQSLLLGAQKTGDAIFTMTTTPLAWEKNCLMAESCPNVRVGLGLHPQLVSQRAGEVELFERLVPRAKFIGEVGLDAGPRFYKSLALQQSVLERILRAAKGSEFKIVSLHSVRSAGKVMDLIEKVAASNLRFVFHWFTGSKAEGKRAAEMGAFFSINQMMFASDRSRDVLGTLPLRRLLTETDGPFVLNCGGEPLLPGDVSDVLGHLAKMHEVPQREVQEQIWQNLSVLERPFESPIS